MAIPAHYIQELIDRNDVCDVISRQVNLKRHGRIYKGLCPFHSERSPSFTVYPETQSYYCFGCGAGGDIITFTKEIDGLTYVEAVKSLAQQCGMPLPEEDDSLSRLKARIYQMNKLAARYYFNNLNSDDGKEARRYFRERQLSDKTIVNFGLGYASDSWQGLTSYLKSQGFTDDELISAYLSARNKNGKLYDIFRNRVIFPIIDLRGNVIAFGGRILTSEGGPKYLNSGDTPVFKKSNGLFALNIAKKSKQESLILAEGYMDVIALHQAGFDNAIATLGTALTQQQSKLIGDYSKKVIISYDSDEAGQRATKRAIDIFSKEDIKIQVLQIPDAKDPDEYIKKFGAERFQLLLDGANSSLDFELLKLKSKFDLSIADDRITYVTQACAILAKLKNPIQQDVYAQKLSTQSDTSKDAIKLQIEKLKKEYYRKENYNKNKQLLKEGVTANLKVDFRQEGNTLPKVFAQQQIIYGLLKNNSFYDIVSTQLSLEDFTDLSMKHIYNAFGMLYKQQKNVDFTELNQVIPADYIKILAQIIARNNDIIKIDKTDMEHYVNSLKTAKLLDREVKEKSAQEIAQRIQSLKEKKK